MKLFAIIPGGALALALTACVPQPKATPPIVVRPSPTPTPVASQSPAFANWMDAPATPGDWSYRPAPTGGTALFGEPSSGARFTMRCDLANRTVVLSRAGDVAAPGAITIRTESQTRTLAPTPDASALPAIETTLSANDRLLDAMALSKGRFAVEVAGTPPLYLPSWAEVTRVIEDCR